MSTDDLSSLFDAQYEALRAGCGVVELSRWSSVTVTGADRQSFLHNFCTNNIKRLVPATNCEAFFTNVKGKIVGHGLVTCRADELVVIMVPDQAARIVEHLDRYLIREDVALHDTSAERDYRLAAGDRARDVIAEIERSLSAEVPLQVMYWNVSHGQSVAIIESRPEDVAKLQQALAARGAVACGREAWETVRIEWGLPLFGVDFDDSNFPQEVGRNDRAISLTKGCYLGQETVARIDALGHVNRQLVGVRFSAAEVPPAAIELSLGGTAVGRVRSAAFSPRLAAPLALAIVRQQCATPGSRLHSPVGDCEVISLPVSDNDG